MVLEIKQRICKIPNASESRSGLPKNANAGSRPELEYKTFLEKLYYLIKKVHAHECELVSENGEHRLPLRIDKMHHGNVDDLRGFLGEGFISLVVVAEGVAFSNVGIRIRSEFG